MIPLSIAIVVLVLLSGFFSATETAYSCANKIKLKSMVTLGKKHAKAVYELAEDKYDKLITAILVGTLMFGEPLTTNILVGIIVAIIAVTFMITVTKR